MTFIKVEFCFDRRSNKDKYLSYSILTEIIQCVVHFDKINLNTNNQIQATNIYNYGNDSDTFTPRFETRTEVYTKYVSNNS